MQDTVDPLADCFDLAEIGQIGGLEGLAFVEIGRAFDVAEQEIRINRGQQRAQRCADSSGSAGQQDAWHSFIPRYSPDLTRRSGEHRQTELPEASRGGDYIDSMILPRRRAPAIESALISR